MSNRKSLHTKPKVTSYYTGNYFLNDRKYFRIREVTFGYQKVNPDCLGGLGQLFSNFTKV